MPTLQRRPLRPSLLSKIPRIAVLAMIAVVVVGGGFAAASTDLAYGAQSLLAAVVQAALPGEAKVFILRRDDSPTGHIKANYSYPIAIFRVHPSLSLRDQSFFQDGIYVDETQSSGTSGLHSQSPTLLYTYCVPTSKSRGYGYSGTQCYSTNLSATSVTQTSSTTNRIRFGLAPTTGTPRLPVDGDQVAARLAFYDTIVYGPGDSSKPGRIKADIVGAAAAGPSCYAAYGYAANSSLNSTCTYKSIPVDYSLAQGRWLIVDAPLHYGFKPTTKAATSTKPATVTP